MNKNINSKIIYLATPRGFCAGVSRAIEIVERVLSKYPDQSVYVFHEVVHNKHVVNNLRQKGAIFVDKLEDIPNKSIVIFSAHGVSKAIEQLAINKELIIFDATCPIVDKVHRKVRKLSDANEEVIMIGHSGHQEVEGTLGQYTSKDGGIYSINNIEEINKLNVKNPSKLHFVTQTTLSMDETKQSISALQQKFPDIIGPNNNDICYATQNRQHAIKEVTKLADIVLVVGSKNSSNSNRLKEVSESVGGTAYLIDDYTDLNLSMIENVNSIAITGGASAPECLIDDLIKHLNKFGFNTIKEIGSEKEKQSFKMPPELC